MTIKEFTNIPDTTSFAAMLDPEWLKKLRGYFTLPTWSLLSTNDEGTFRKKIMKTRSETNQHQTEKLTPSGYTKTYSVS